MGRRVGPPRTITVVVPKHGTPAAPHSLLKAVSATVKKQNPRAQFQEQDPITSSELQEFEEASNWNGLLLNARGERGPQWDVSGQTYHVEIGSEEYFDPTLLEEERKAPPTPPPEVEEPIEDTMMQHQTPHMQQQPMGMMPQEIHMNGSTPMYHQQQSHHQQPPQMHPAYGSRPPQPHMDMSMRHPGHVPQGYTQYGQPVGVSLSDMNMMRQVHPAAQNYGHPHQARPAQPMGGIAYNHGVPPGMNMNVQYGGQGQPQHGGYGGPPNPAHYSQSPGMPPQGYGGNMY